MDEKSVANKLDTIFSDVRINPIYLAMLTRRLFGRQTHKNAEEWWAYHNLDIEQLITGNRDNDLSDYD